MKEIKSFDLPFGYAQLSVFNSSLINPFNKWTLQHYEQGFSWQPRSVAFRLLSEFGILKVNIKSDNKITLKQDTVRSIVVPFSVDSMEAIEFASVDSDPVKISISKDEYSLVFETGYLDENFMWADFTFVPNLIEVAQILRADKELTRTVDLVMGN